MRVLHYFFYEGYETLDIMGPIEMLGTLNENGEYFDVHYVSVEGGPIKSFQSGEVLSARPVCPGHHRHPGRSRIRGGRPVRGLHGGAHPGSRAC